MAKVITIGSQKGGVGQTATVLNLGYSLSRLGPKVLLVDADPQAGMSMGSRLKQETSVGILDLLKGKARLKEAVRPAREGNLDLLGPGAVEAEEVIFYEKEALRGNLSKVIRTVGEGYDYVFIDAPTGLGVTTYACMAVSNGVIIPLTPGALAIRSLASLFKFIKRIRVRAKQDLRVEGVLFTQTDMTSEHEVGIINDVRENLPPEICFETVIPFDPAFEQANVREAPAALLPEGQNAARAYLDLAVEVRLREMEENRQGGNDEQSDGLF